MSEVVEYHNFLMHNAANLLTTHFGLTIPEFRLPNGRIADLITATHNNSIIITEVKAYLTASLISAAVAKYAPYCHKLFIAAPKVSIEAGLFSAGFLQYGSDARSVGLIGVANDNTSILRMAPEGRIPTATAGFLIQRLRAHPKAAHQQPIAGGQF